MDLQGTRRARVSHRVFAAPAGFTLFEALVVLGIMGILLAIGLPSYLNYASNQRAVATARRSPSHCAVYGRTASQCTRTVHTRPLGKLL